MAELRRPRNGRLIGGVCAALADRFGWNVSLVRLIAVLSILIPGPQVIFYIVAWVLIPGEPAAASGSTHTRPPEASGVTPRCCPAAAQFPRLA